MVGCVSVDTTTTSLLAAVEGVIAFVKGSEGGGGTWL